MNTQIIFADGNKESFLDLLVQAVKIANTVNQPRRITTKEAAQVRGVKEKTINEWVATGRLEPLIKGSGRRSHLFDYETVMAA